MQVDAQHVRRLLEIIGNYHFKGKLGIHLVHRHGTLNDAIVIH